MNCSIRHVSYLLLFIVAISQGNQHNVVLARDLEQQQCDPLRIFILAGQSNMVGFGNMEHLFSLLDIDKKYGRMWNKEYNKWKSLQHIYIKFDDKHGKLTVGYGAGENGEWFGPELGFGWAFQRNYQKKLNKENGCTNPILLLKTAYGGRDLAIDFRSPSSGSGDYGVEFDHYGWQYREMLQEISDTINYDLPDLVPDYDANVGYKIMGLVWFQGWNDVIDQQKVDEYESNLANFIRDIRKDLDVPGMPVVIGELGQHGVNYDPEPDDNGAKDRVLKFRKAQESVALSEEFQETTRFATTKEFVVEDDIEYQPAYHYHGRADTFYNIGLAFGKAMVNLVNATNM